MPALPPDVPPPVCDLVYHMLAKTPEERPAGVRAVADRADMLRDALAMSESAAPGYPGETRADLPAAATDLLFSGDSPGGPFPRRPLRRRQLVAAGSAAALCAAAVATGLYLTGHFSGKNGGGVGSDTAQHLSTPATTPTHRASQHPRLTPRPSLVVKPSVTVPSPAGNPKPTKSVKPTSSTTISPSASTSTSASSSPTTTNTGSPTATPTNTDTQAS